MPILSRLLRSVTILISLIAFTSMRSSAHHRWYTVFFVLATLFPARAFAQWISQNEGLEGGRATAMVLSGSRLFSGVIERGIYYSDDRGETWISVTSIPTRDCLQLVAREGKVYAATSGGVYASEDNGTTWSYLTGVNFTNSIALKGDYLFAAPSIGGMQRYSLITKNWQSVSKGLEGVYIYQVSVFGNTVYAGTDKGMFRSTDNGDSWVKDAANFSNLLVTYFASSATSFFVVANSSIYRSADGVSWTKISLVGGVTSVGVVGTVVYAGTYDSGIYRSINNGVSWTLVTSGLPRLRVTTFSDGGNATTFLGTENAGVFKSTDGGLNWSAANKGINAAFVKEISISGTTLFAATRNGVFMSTDNASHWVSKSAGLKERSLSVHNVIGVGSKIYIGTSGGVYISNDNAQTWVPSNTGLPTTIVTSLIRTVNGNFYASVNTGQVYRSTDNGLQWTAVNDGITITSSGGILRSNGNDVYVSIEANGVYRLTDGTSTWTKANSGLEKVFVYDFAFHGSYVYAASKDKIGIFRSADKGVTWAPHILNIDDYITIGLAANETGIYALTLNGVHKLFDDSDSKWLLLKDTNAWMTSINIANGRLYIGGEGQLLSVSLAELVVGVDEPTTETTLPVFPNPARDQVYLADQSESTNYTIMDLTGKMVKQGVTESGNGAQHLTVDELPNGIYVLRTVNHKGTINIRLVVQKN